MATVEQVCAGLRKYRLRFGTESVLQSDVEAALLSERLAFVREFRLGSNEVDFFVDGIGIECKVDGGPSAVLEQLLRYAEFGEITGLVLVTRRRTHRFSETTLGGKPFRVLWIAGVL